MARVLALACAGPRGSRGRAGGDAVDRRLRGPAGPARPAGRRGGWPAGARPAALAAGPGGRGRARHLRRVIGPAPACRRGAASWVLADLDTGAVLAAHAPHARHRPASTLKVLTALVVASHARPGRGGRRHRRGPARSTAARPGIGPGGQYTVRAAARRAAAQLRQRRRAGAGPRAGRRRRDGRGDGRRRRSELGALDTRPATPSGLDGPGMASSAYDLALLFRVAMRDPLFAETIGPRSIPFPGYGDLPGFVLSNSNKLLARYAGAIGGKTGFTDAARHTLVGAAERDGRRLVVALMRGEQHPVADVAAGAPPCSTGASRCPPHAPPSATWSTRRRHRRRRRPPRRPVGHRHRPGDPGVTPAGRRSWLPRRAATIAGAAAARAVAAAAARARRIRRRDRDRAPLRRDRDRVPVSRRPGGTRVAGSVRLVGARRLAAAAAAARPPSRPRHQARCRAGRAPSPPVGPERTTTSERITAGAGIGTGSSCSFSLARWPPRPSRTG